MTPPNSAPAAQIVPGTAHQPNGFEHFDLESMSKGDVYKVLGSVIMPRPIAWVVSRNAGGTLNAAPYSFFNILSANPPLVAVSFSAPPDRTEKDSLSNLRRNPEFVINLVSEDLADAMNVTAVNAPRGTDETVLAGLEMAPSSIVAVPRIARSPVALECRVQQEIATGGPATIVLARILYAHITSAGFSDRERLHIDPNGLRLIGRMHGGGGYTTTRDLFNLDRPAWPLS